MTHFMRRNTGRRLALEWCEPRRLLSTTQVSTAELDGTALPLVNWEASFDFSYSTGIVSNSLVVTNGFLPTPIGTGSVPIDGTSRLATIDTVAPELFGGEALNFGQPGGIVHDFVFSDFLSDRSGSSDSSRFDDFRTVPPAISSTVPTLVRERHSSAPREPFVDQGTELRSAAPVVPIDSDGLPEQPATEPAASSVVTTPQSTAETSALLEGPALTPSPSYDTTPTTSGNDSASVTDNDDWLAFPGSGAVTDPLPDDEPSVHVEGGWANGDENDDVWFQPTGSGEFATTSEDNRRDETDASSDENARRVETARVVSAIDAGVERLANRPAPPAGTDGLGAGTIDLSGLLFDDATPNEPIAAEAIAAASAAQNHEELARDAALAVESWVRAIPSPAAPSAAAEAGKSIEGASPAIGAAVPVERPAGSVTISIDGDRLSAVEASSREPASAERATPEVGTSAAARIERPSAYRYAMSAISVLLGGAVFSLARGRDSDAPSGRKPANEGHPRPTGPSREID